MILDLLSIVAVVAAALTVAGLVQVVAGFAALVRFRRNPPPDAAVLPPVTILKPLHGDEPLLEAALASAFQQDYPAFQLVFGLQSPDDPALATLDRLRARFPHVAADVVVDRRQHGVNRKIGNLINMMPKARHDVLVIADSDMHVAPDYLRRLVAALRPDVGLVTTLYAGLPATTTLAGQLGSAQINHAFLPGALQARLLGRQDCLGATMALRRETLERAGGLAALADQLADDAVLGQLVLQQGLGIALAGTIPATTVPETRLRALLQHEMRWARTISSLAPIGFALSAVQYPMAWAALALVLSGGSAWSFGLFAGAWLWRYAVARLVDGRLGVASRLRFWAVPLRDVLSLGVLVASYRTRRVAWRGQEMVAVRPGLAPGKG